MQWSFVECTHNQIAAAVKRPLCIVHLTDLHGTTRFLNGSISAIVNNIQPDLIMVTGDLVSNQCKLQRVLDELGKLECMHIYFVPGNYEREQWVRFKKQPISSEQYNEILNQIRARNLSVLNNKHAIANVKGSKLLIYGFDNSIYGNERYDHTVEKMHCDFKVLLAHSPSIITEIHRQNTSYNLLLTGHTHGGQIRFGNRTIGPYKHYHVGIKKMEEGRYFLINRGIGTVRIPLRINCKPEISVIHVNPN